MPSALPGLSTGKAAELLQQSDRLIATVPEVKGGFGKIGRAETATDPAPLGNGRNGRAAEDRAPSGVRA
jgi:Cu(I)/Ag(I) efflux system membrane protein CusA/SilA